MKVLHICRDFVGSKVHSGLYKHLDNLGLEQIVYSIYRDRYNAFNNSNYFESLHTQIIYRPILKIYHRVLFFAKTRKTIQDIEKCIDLNKTDLIHATTVFTDGAVARAISQKYNIPYIVTARNTDYNDFVKHAPHLWFVHRNVLRNASKIMFITDRLRNKFLNHFTLSDLRFCIKDRVVIQSNGVNEYWLNHLSEKRDFNHNILYIGNFEPTKNVVRLISSVLKLKQEISDIHLDIVGGGGWQNKAVLKSIGRNNSFVTFHGKVYDKNVLREYYKKCTVFAMPSIHETFGLVYIEALSQGMKVLFSKNEGIDGVFDKKVGEAVNPLKVDDITKALRKLIKEPSKYDTLSKNEIMQFDWTNIAKVYKDMYSNVLKK